MLTMIRVPTEEEFKKRAAALKEKLPAWVLSLEFSEAFTGFPAVDALVIVKDGHDGPKDREQIKEVFYEELIRKDDLDVGFWQILSQSSWREVQQVRAVEEAQEEP